MSIKIKRGRGETFFAFFLSPFLSLPLIALQLKRNDNAMLKLIALLFGLLSFAYVPHTSNDKARYYARFLEYTNYDLNEFLLRLTEINRPDFVFESLIFSFSKLNWNIQWLFLILTAFTVFSILCFIKKVVEIETRNVFQYNLWIMLMVIFSFSLSGLFSGVRFYFGGSIFIWGVYYLFFSQKAVKASLLLLLATFTHFSFAFFIPVILFAYYFPTGWNPKPFLVISLLFLLLPKDYLANIFGFLQLPESYSSKTEAYLEYNRDVSQNSIILTLLRNSWLYFTYIYLLVRQSDKSKLYIIAILFTTLVNLTFSIPVVFNRYTIILKILFIAYYLYLHQVKLMSSKILLLLGVLFLLSFIVDVNVLRYNFAASYAIEDMWTIIHFISKKVNVHEFLN